MEEGILRRQMGLENTSIPLLSLGLLFFFKFFFLPFKCLEFDWVEFKCASQVGGWCGCVLLNACE